MEYSIKPKRLGERGIIHYPQKRIIGLYVNHMAEQNLFCLCGRCSRKLRSAAARRVGMGSTCCRKETGKTITQLLKELDEQEAAAAAEQQEPDTQA